MPAKKIIKSPTAYPAFLLVFAFAIGFCTHLLISVIFAESNSDGVIHACANKRSGELRVITNYKDYREGKLEKLRRDSREDSNGCRENETALEWNVQGPPGPSGGTTASFPLVCAGCSIGTYAGDLFVGKDLSNAILANSSLQGTNFSGVNFTNARLIQSDLSQANLSKTNLERADLSGAQTEGVNWEGAIWKNTTCPDGSNSDANGGSCEAHMTPTEE